uniref:ATP synthase CF1 alpha chain n=1 Tax=Pyrocystis lunula TaxID=2972 RepID=A0A2R4QHB7_PYRLU|nr:ATP synthase CF1 alpha chain [Pyrocystis lunula]
MVVVKSSFRSGVVLSLSSGVVTLQGFLSAWVGELFRVASSLGLVVNLYRDRCLNIVVGALLFNPESAVSVGIRVEACRLLATIVLGFMSIGSILDPLGNFILTPCRIDAQYRWVIESAAPSIISRMSVFEPLETGIISVDSLIPIGRGQRELLVGDRQTGKTSIGIDSILNQKYGSLLCVYVPIGQKASSIIEVFLSLVVRDASFYVSLLVAAASSSAVCQFMSGYTGSSLSEFFMLSSEIPSFLMLDDLSKHAVAYREIYLLLRRPPGREAYPGEIFFVHSRLLERSSKLSTAFGGGSCTSFPVIETLAGDVSAYITTNVISITDGQLFLSLELFLSGVKPGIDVGLSVTRVGSAAQWNGMKILSGSYKLELAQLVELQAFSQFAAELGAETIYRLARGRILLEMLKQCNGSPIGLPQQLGVLSLCNQDIIRTIDVDRVQTLLQSYYSVPQWVAIIVPSRMISTALI